MIVMKGKSGGKDALHATKHATTMEKTEEGVVLAKVFHSVSERLRGLSVDFSFFLIDKTLK